MSLPGGLVSVGEATCRILAGETLLLAGEEELLLALPPGRWIGGTASRFMTGDGPTATRHALFAAPLPPEVLSTEIVVLDASEIGCVLDRAPDNGFTVLLVPWGSRAHVDFARGAPDRPGAFLKPLVGWVTATRPEDIGAKSPQVVDGTRVAAWSDRAVVLHATLPPGCSARVHVTAPYRKGEGAPIVFPADAFGVRDCLIDGARANLARHLVESGLGVRRPLVADYNGVPVSVGIRTLDTASGTTTFQSPVFAGVEYRLASEAGPSDPSSARPPAALAFHCAQDFDGSREGGSPARPAGPFGAGAIAYQVLDRAAVVLTVGG